MAVLGTLLRWRRGESIVLAALLLACLFMPVAAQGAVLPPQQAHAVLLWLQVELAPDVAASPQRKRGDALLSLQQRDNTPIYSSCAPIAVATPPDEVRLATLQVESRPIAFITLEAHEAAFLTGVRNNRRRN